MALTKISTDGFKDDAVTTDKLANAINTERTANTAKVSLDADSVTGAKIADDAVGAEHIEVLDSHLQLTDNSNIKLGTGDDLLIYHNGSDSYVKNSTGDLYIRDTNGNVYIQPKTDENGIKCIADGAVELYHDNTKKFETSSVGVSSLDTLITHGVIRPADDNNHAIGLSNRRYTEIFAVNGSINTSDKTEKNTIVESDLGLDFIKKLKPVSYKWNKDDGKTHYGLIAQDIEETITSLGKTVAEFGGVSKEKDSPMGLSYSELLSPLIKAVQELSAEVTTLKTKVAALEAA